MSCCEDEKIYPFNANSTSSPVELRGDVVPDFQNISTTSMSASAQEFCADEVQFTPTRDIQCSDREENTKTDCGLIDRVNHRINNGTHIYMNRNSQFVLDGPAELESSRKLCVKSKEITNQIKSGKYECVCCLDVIGQRSAVWSCQHCYRLLHLHCIRKWANTIESGAGKNFRCPHCQMETTGAMGFETTPLAYLCYCKKMRDPKFDPSIIPHSCGEVCGKERGTYSTAFDGSRIYNCPHPCEALCHPGPCPPCSHSVMKCCPCGATSYSHECGGLDPRNTCDGICNKPMTNCSLFELTKHNVFVSSSGVSKQDQMFHTCPMTCHTGPCDQCENVVTISCVCGKEIRDVICGSQRSWLGDLSTSSTSSSTMNGPERSKNICETNNLIFSCDQQCGKLLQCGVHKCPVKCHADVCPPCDTDTRLITTCPCGKTQLTVRRTSCLDPIPVCGQKCGKPLLCGNHFCDEDCHLGQCPPCNKKSYRSCQCGNLRMKIYCSDHESLKCGKMCKTQLNCGKHVCKVVCCPGRNKGQHLAHVCQGVCGKRLPCGHFCPEYCHRDSCPPCLNIITDFLRCACGAEVLEPPLPCGTQLPHCHRQCLVEPSCKHTPVTHTCHVGPCPMCPHLVDMMCAGNHQIVKNVRCGSKTVTCGKECGKVLQCGHLCQRPCHGDPCQSIPVSGESVMSCSQKCDKLIPECGHFCTKRCHPNDKDSISCKCTSVVEMKCSCGYNRKNIPCKKYRCLLNESVKKPCDNSHAKEGDYDTSRVQQLPVLECNDDCNYHNRLRFFSNGTYDPNTDLKDLNNQKKTIYSIEAWCFAKNDIDQVKSIEGHLNRFALRSTNNTSAHSNNVTALPPMSSQKRKIVHILCLYYRIKCESYDMEPNRSCHLSMTYQTRVPTPLLSEASLTTRGDTNTIKFLRNTLGYCREVSLRVLLFIGPNLSERIINESHLRSFVGSFVVVRSTDAEETIRDLGIPSESKKPLIANNLLPLIDENVFFVSFMSVEDLDNCFSYLRKTSKHSFKYQRIAASEESEVVDPASSVFTLVANASPASRGAVPLSNDNTVSWSGRMESSREKHESEKTSEQPFTALGGKFSALWRK